MATENKSTGYGAGSITYFESDLHKVRAKPQMYIGPTDTTGVFTILREAMDNAVDEYQAGNNRSVSIYIDKQMWVVDSGRGIPVDIHPKAKKSTLTVALTSLQSSGKMDATGKGAYATSIGTHGVGLKATNALSRAFDVWTCRNGQWWHTSFAKGDETSKVAKSKAPRLPDGKSPKIGTVIRFEPDNQIFGKASLEVKDVANWAQITSYMNPGLSVTLTAKGKTKTWLSKKGVVELLAKQVKRLEANVLGKTLVHGSKTLDLAIAFTDAEGDKLVDAHTNTIRNVEYGVHMSAFWDALGRSLKPYGNSKMRFTPSDLREGVVGVLNYKIASPRFDSQTKEKLVDERVGKPCLEECLEVLEAFWKRHKNMAKQVVQRASDLNKSKVDFQQQKRAMRELKTGTGPLKLPGKLTTAKCAPDKRELFLVEGESAGGTAKFARDKTYQEVFYLRGKILNAERATDSKVLESEEVLGILKSIGFDPSKKEPMKSLRVGRIIGLTDPDDDGYHITSLILTLLAKYVPDLFTRGMVYAVDAAEYVGTVKGKLRYAQDKHKLIKLNGGKAPKDMMHLKGWGEATVVQLRRMAFDPKQRKLCKLSAPTDGGKRLKLIMSEDPAIRKVMLGV